MPKQSNKISNLSPGLRNLIEPERDKITLRTPVAAFAEKTLRHTNGGATMQAALWLKNHLDKGGKLIVVGLYGGEIPLSLVLVVQRAWRIQGSSVGTVAELKEVIALARAGKIKPIPIEKRPLSEVSRTLDQLKAGKITGRVVAAIE
jgi:D-arabinose 1-dehydrogenase-like Zn-dependent alcohol dehydrogenase